MLDAYINRLDLSTGEDRTKVGLDLSGYKSNPSNKETQLSLKQFILRHEPNLKNFLQQIHRVQYDPQSMGLPRAEYSRELMSTRFMVNLFAVNCQIPMFSIPPRNESLSEQQQPLLSFVLPTIDTLNMLQKITHGEEATMPEAVIGQVTPRMIRAYDDIPALKGSGQPKNKAQGLLSVLYPTASQLDSPARPIEFTYPGVEKTVEPHGADCHDFLLSWHDVFHAWRNGSNYKAWIRQLRTLHDEKLGFAVQQDAMSKIIWELSDVDFSGGTVYRAHEKRHFKSKIAIVVFLNIAKKAGYSFATPEDDNYLFAYTLSESPGSWGNPYGIDLQNLDAVVAGDPSLETNFNLLKKQVAHVHAYMREHPKASVVEIIIHDLLVPTEGSDAGLLQLLNQADLKNFFYWSSNTGLYFKKEYREELSQLGIKPTLRDNSADLIRSALKQMALTKIGTPKLIEFQMELITSNSCPFGDGRRGDQAASKQVKIKTKEAMRGVLNASFDIEIANPNAKYDLLHEKYQALFAMISSTTNGLYTRKSGPSFFHSNEKTRGLTDTQLLHIGFLKQLFIEDVKTLMASNGNEELIDLINSDIGKPDCFINFNRTRFNLFVKETTTSRKELQTEVTDLTKRFKKDLSIMKDTANPIGETIKPLKT